MNNRKTTKLKVAAVLLALLLVISAFQPATITANALSNEQVIYNFLISNMSLSTAAACGVIANIERESAFSPNAIGDNGTSFGICQWHNTRWTNLKNFCSNNGYDYTSLTGQLNYLNYELNTSQYKSVINYLRSVDNTSQGAYDAAAYWCIHFEIPANASAQAVSRGNNARNNYWPKYGAVTDDHIVDNRFSKDFVAYLTDPMTKHYCFNADHTYNEHYVDDVDPCTINEVYTDGCCKFTYTTTVGKEITTFGYITWFDVDFCELKIGKYKTTANSGLRLRSTASLNGEQLDLIPYGTEVSVSEISGSWGKTSYNGYTGWISMEYAEWVGENTTPVSSYENTHVNTGNPAFDIVEVAKTQIGYSEGSNNNNKYGAYFGTNYASWCAYFVVWCARQAGIGSDVVKFTGWATADDLGVTYKGRNVARTEAINYVPKPGDFIIYDWSSNGYSNKSPASFYGDHVGIVEYVDNGYVHTIEGNYDDAVRRRVIALDSEEIKGFGVPSYNLEAEELYENTHINIGTPAFDIVEVAKTQVGYTEGTNNDNKYGAYFGSNNVSWCAYFVVWCARQADIDSSTVKLTGWATADDLGAEYHGRNADRTEEINYTPKPGDFIIYDWTDGGYCTKSPASFYGDHVGIVEYVENGYVHTIEGNYDDAVRRRVIALDNEEIKGYGVPAYNIQVHEHSYLPTVSTAPTCSEPGVKTYVCSCGDSYREAIPATEHQFKNIVLPEFLKSEATCTSPEIYYKACSFCGAISKDTFTSGEANGHSLKETVIPPTEKEQGYTVHSCMFCDYSYTDSFTSPTGVSNHIPGDINGDGAVNNNDLTRLMKYLAGAEVEVVDDSIDTNGDGEVNNKDLTRLMKYIAGGDIEIF